MQRLNAIDAISPAFTRTHELLFKPFRIGRSWKLSASAYLAMAGSIFFPVPLLLFTLPYLPAEIAPVARVIFPFLIGIYTLFIFGFFYLGARMGLVVFEVVVTQQVILWPMWKRYSGRVWPWIGLKALVGTVLTLALSPMLLSMLRGFVTLITTILHMPKGTPPDPEFVSSILQAYFSLYGTILLCFLVLKVASTLLDDFVRPYFLLEDISLGAALQRGFAMFTANWVDCLLYVFLKYILGAIGGLMQGIIGEIVILLIVAIFALVGLIGWAILHLLGTAGSVLMVVGAILLGVSFLVVYFYAVTGIAGYLMMLLESYAVYFLGGRYPLLGSLLEPGPGGPFTPPPVFPSKAEEEDSPDGPSLPMNPAVA
jgi:hypothetical protein